MLAGEGTAEGERLTEQGSGRIPHPFRDLASRDHEVGVQIAVARMRDGGNVDPVLGFDAGDRVEHRRHRAAGHRHVFDENAPAGLHRAVERSTKSQKILALLPGVGRLRFTTGLVDDAQRLSSLRRAQRTIGLHHEARPASAPRRSSEKVADPLHGAGVEELHDGGTDAGGGDGRTRSGGLPGIREPCLNRGHAAHGKRHELDGGFDNHPEGAFRADHQRSEVEPCDTLDRAVPKRHEGAIGQHDLHAEHRLTGDPVLGAQQAARAGGDVAADRRDRLAGRVRRKPEPERLGSGGEIGVQNARLDHRQLVGCVELENAGHRRQVEHDLASGADCGARESGTCTTRHHWHAVVGRESHHLLNLLYGCRAHDRQGDRRRPVPGLVRAGSLERGGIRHDAATEPIAEPREELVARGAGHNVASISRREGIDGTAPAFCTDSAAAAVANMAARSKSPRAA